MKEIKVRAWDKKLRVMWEPITLTKLLAYLIFQIEPNAEAYMALKDHFKDIEWLEYIDKKDKNGKEIYEGDILRGNLPYEKSTEHPLVVIHWDEKGAAYIVQEINGPRMTIPISWIYAYEIIGNIYEHKYLLDMKIKR